MKSFKKILSMVLVCASIVSLASCGGEKKIAETTDGAVIVTFWSGNAGQKEYEEAKIKEFNQTKGKEIGVEIKYECKSDYSTQLNVAFETNQQPDLFGGVGIKDSVDKGRIISYEDIEGGAEYVKHFESVNMYEGKYTYKGKHYSLPQNSLVCGLVYNKDLFKEAGIVNENGEPTPPETLDQMREYAKRITDLGDNRYGIAFPVKWNAWILYDVQLAGVNSAGRQSFDYGNGVFDFSGYIPVLENIKGILDDKSAYPGAETLDNDPARARFAEGKIGMKVAWSWDVGVFEDQFPATCDWGVAPLPVADENQKYYQYMNIDGSALMGKTLKDKLTDEQIFEMMKWLTSDEQVQKAYESGIYLPWNAEIMQKADVSNVSEHWAEFAKLIEISQIYPPVANADTTGQPTFQELFINEVLNGDMTVEEMCRKCTDIHNAGMKKYNEANPHDTSDNYVCEADMSRK